ncbi:MAG: 3'(2'),5'-bisphosphate nucleotidase CysQ [Acidimicrobiaceae bacterium]|nr:3'(2'),5'-bisphosphate nucleotidase CysQ [Acidimicrobiaceae bacterium]
MATPGDHTLAAELATRAGELLLDIRDRLTVDGAPSAVMRHEGDQRSHEYLMAALAEHRPTDAVLSEEGTAHAVHPDRTGADRIWIVDPVDGTREYSEPPRSDWAVHVALVEEGRPTAGAVALPALGLTLSTVGPPYGSDLPPIGDRPRMVVSRSRPPAEALAVCEALGGELVEMGSAGAKAMAVVRGEVDAYVHSGGQYEWDSCAPVAVAEAAGLHTSRIDGSPLTYNRSDPYLPDLVICRADLAEAILSALAG